MYGICIVLKTMLCGCGAVAVWDLFAALRNAVNIKGVTGFVLDMLSPVSFAVCIWCTIFCIADGNTGYYEFMCIAAGALLYILTVKRFVYRLFYIVFLNIFKFIVLILKILLTPGRFLYKMLCVGLYAKKGADTAPESVEDRQC